MTGDGLDGQEFLSLVAAEQEKDRRLTPVQCTIVVAARLGIAQDSRGVARIFGIPHALVLRELSILADLSDIVDITRRDPRTLRTYYALKHPSSHQNISR